MKNYSGRIFCAIDTPDLTHARTAAMGMSGVLSTFKLGLEFFIANGPEGVAEVRQAAGHESKFFLDLKLHDIPNTVAGAVRSAVACDIDFLTVHTAGGPAMIRAAVDAAKDEATKTGRNSPMILGVTVLTSMDESDLAATGVAGAASDQVMRLAEMGAKSGLKGLVCSAHEIERLKKTFGKDMTLVVPGIRPAGVDAGDQKRVMTPKEAFDAGADYLVIGRPITGAKDPAQAAKDILALLQ